MHHDDLVAAADRGSAPCPAHIAGPMWFDGCTGEESRPHPCRKLPHFSIELQDLLVLCEKRIGALDVVLQAGHQTRDGI